MFLVGLMLAAVAAANLLATHFVSIGHPEYTAYTAAALVPIAFVVRDRLHDRWERARVAKLGALIAAGGVIAYLCNPDSQTIAIASCAAFAASEAFDALVYHLTRRHPWLIRSNASNFVGACVDSAVFVALAFPGFLFAVAFGQATAKVAGGIVSSVVLARRG